MFVEKFPTMTVNVLTHPVDVINAENKSLAEICTKRRSLYLIFLYT